MKVALIGAGGKMGGRITDNLVDKNYEMAYIEVSEKGIHNLKNKGLSVTPLKEAVSSADIVILAVPDTSIHKVAESVVYDMPDGSLLMLLDPAAAYAGELPMVDSLSYFIAHPCHPSVFHKEITIEAVNDRFGGVAAPQSIVCTLLQGPEQDYEKGMQLAKDMFAPVKKAHRLTLEQMAVLEPAMAETVGAATAMILKEAMEEAVHKGVPEEAARDFMLGHINIVYAVVLGEVKGQLSDACIVAAEYGKKQIFKDDWKELFEPQMVKKQIDMMLHPEKMNQSS